MIKTNPTSVVRPTVTYWGFKCMTTISRLYVLVLGIPAMLRAAEALSRLHLRRASLLMRKWSLRQKVLVLPLICGYVLFAIRVKVMYRYKSKLQVKHQMNHQVNHFFMACSGFVLSL